MIPEGQSFPFPPLPFQMKKNYQCKKMKWTIATSLLNYTERKVCKKTRANLKLNYPLPSHWTLLSIQKKEERTKTKKNQEKTPQLTLSLQRHLLKWRQERKDQKEGFFNTSDEPNQAVWSSLPVPLFCQPLKEHSPGMNHIDPRLQGKKKGKPDHRNLLMKSIREDG